MWLPEDDSSLPDCRMCVAAAARDLFVVRKFVSMLYVPMLSACNVSCFISAISFFCSEGFCAWWSNGYGCSPLGFSFAFFFSFINHIFLIN